MLVTRRGTSRSRPFISEAEDLVFRGASHLLSSATLVQVEALVMQSEAEN